MTTNKTKRLKKKQFTKILKLPSAGNYDKVTSEEVNHMFNVMGHQAILSVISHFMKSSLTGVWNFFGMTLRCLTGRSFGLDISKIKFYLIMNGMYYGLNIDYASLL